MKQSRTIHDTVHGAIDLGDSVSNIVSTKEFQRLNTVKQLGFTYLVFPGATHSRFEHSLGTYYLSNEAGKMLGLDEKNILEVSLAGLLHDIGHSPFSHSLEDSMLELYGKDHLDVTIDIIEGKTPENEVGDALGEYKKPVVEILKGRKGVASRLISGNGDMDQIDYLARDSHYTGVALGAVDIARIMRVLSICKDDLCIMEKGLPSVEGLLVARMLMYRSVYRHKTALIAASLANDSLKVLNPDYDSFVQWNDCDFVAELKRNRETLGVYNRLKYRNLPMGALVKTDEREFRELKDDLDGLLLSYQYLKSPFKKEVLKVQTDGGIRPVTDFSSIMQFLEGELVGMGLFVFESNVEKDVHRVFRKSKARIS